MEKTELYSKKLTHGSRTYFFDINRSEKNEIYFKISESNKHAGFEHQRIMVFEEVMPEFAEAFWDCMTTFQKLKKGDIKAEKVDYYSKIRETFANAYVPWTQDDDDKLIFMHSEGFKVNELSKIFQRNEGAIESRIKHLEIR